MKSNIVNLNNGLKNVFKRDFDRAYQQAMKGNFQEAAEIYSSIILKLPECAEAYCNRANVYWELGEYSDALDDYNESLRLHKDPMVCLNVAQLYAELELPEKAIEYCNKAIEIEPLCEAAYVLRAELNGILGRFAESYEDFEWGSPETDNFFFLRAILKEQTGDIFGAISDYTRAIAADEKNDKALLYRADLYLEMIDSDFIVELAKKDLQKAAQLDNPIAFEWLEELKKNENDE